MNSWVEIDTAEAGRMIKAIDGKRYNNRIIRMNEADGGFKRPSDERRKEIFRFWRKKKFQTVVDAVSRFILNSV